MSYEPYTARLLDITSAYVSNAGADISPRGLALELLDEDVYSDCDVDDVLDYATALLYKEVAQQARFVVLSEV
jgi:hypothetical protein